MRGIVHAVPYQEGFSQNRFDSVLRKHVTALGNKRWVPAGEGITAFSSVLLVMRLSGWVIVRIPNCKISNGAVDKIQLKCS